MRVHRRARPNPSCAALRVSLLIGLTFAGLAASAGGSSAIIRALVTISPPTPALGEHTVKVLLRDAADEPIPGARVLVAIEPERGRSVPGARLQEAAAGIYRGPLTFAAPGTAVLRVEATLPDGVWQGQMPVTIGQGRVAPAASLLLRHRDDPQVTFLGRIVVGAFVVGIVGIAVLGLRAFLDRGRPG